MLLPDIPRKRLFYKIHPTLDGKHSRVASCPAATDSRCQLLEMVHKIEGMDEEEWCELVSKLEELLLSSVSGQKFLLPSKLLSSLTDAMEVIYTDKNLRETLLSHLSILGDLAPIFLFLFISSLVKEILCFIRETVCGHEQYVRRGCDKEFDLHERESVYYIGGSVMRGYFRLAHRYKKKMKSGVS